MTRRVKNWSISDETGILQHRKNVSVQLEPRLAKLFAVLLENEKKLVAREELVKELWPETIVNEDSLTRAVSDLRKILNANFKRPPTIQTAHKRGYQLSLPGIPITKQKWFKVIKIIIYIVLGFILLSLVVRGLHY